MIARIWTGNRDAEASSSRLNIGLLSYISAGSILGGAFLDFFSYRMTYLSYAVLPAVTSIVFTCAMVFKRYVFKLC